MSVARHIGAVGMLLGSMMLGLVVLAALEPSSEVGRAVAEIVLIGGFLAVGWVYPRGSWNPLRAVAITAILVQGLLLMTLRWPAGALQANGILLIVATVLCAAVLFASARSPKLTLALAAALAAGGLRIIWLNIRPTWPIDGQPANMVAITISFVLVLSLPAAWFALLAHEWRASRPVQPN